MRFENRICPCCGMCRFIPERDVLCPICSKKEQKRDKVENRLACVLLVVLLLICIFA